MFEVSEGLATHEPLAIGSLRYRICATSRYAARINDTSHDWEAPSAPDVSESSFRYICTFWHNSQCSLCSANTKFIVMDGLLEHGSSFYHRFVASYTRTLDGLLLA